MKTLMNAWKAAKTLAKETTGMTTWQWFRILRTK